MSQLYPQKSVEGRKLKQWLYALVQLVEIGDVLVDENFIQKAYLQIKNFV